MSAFTSFRTPFDAACDIPARPRRVAQATPRRPAWREAMLAGLLGLALVWALGELALLLATG